jgi:hypothetical protein
MLQMRWTVDAQGRLLAQWEMVPQADIPAIIAMAAVDSRSDPLAGVPALCLTEHRAERQAVLGGSAARVVMALTD